MSLPSVSRRRVPLIRVKAAAFIGCRVYVASGHNGWAAIRVFQLFYLVANPNAFTASIRIAYLRPAPAAPVVKDYVIAPSSRLTIWVNGEDPGLARTDLSAVVSVMNGQPVVVERALYLDAKGQFFGAGHGSAGVTSPGTLSILPVQGLGVRPAVEER